MVFAVHAPILNKKTKDMKFNYRIRKKEEISIIDFAGRILDRSDAKDLIMETDSLLSAGHNKIIVNLTNIDYINSAGLNVLITLLTNTRNNYGELYICEIPDKVKKLIVMSKLENIFSMTTTEEEAYKKLLS